jgi:SsrA-binding protein
VQLVDSYVLLKNGEAYLFGALITPLPTASTHIQPDPTRTRKLLLHRDELDRLIGAVERKGYSLVPTAMYWKKGRAKLEIALAKGKKAHDKRASEKDRDWQREKGRILKGSLR